MYQFLLEAVFHLIQILLNNTSDKIQILHVVDKMTCTFWVNPVVYYHQLSVYCLGGDGFLAVREMTLTQIINDVFITSMGEGRMES